MPTALQSLEASLAALDAPRAPKPALKPAADITLARGYSPALGAIYSPRDSVEFMALQMEADGVQVTRFAGGGFVVGDRISPVMAAALARASFVPAAERAADALQIAAE